MSPYMVVARVLLGVLGLLIMAPFLESKVQLHRRDEWIAKKLAIEDGSDSVLGECFRDAIFLA